MVAERLDQDECSPQNAVSSAGKIHFRCVALVTLRSRSVGDTDDDHTVFRLETM